MFHRIFMVISEHLACNSSNASKQQTSFHLHLTVKTFFILKELVQGTNTTYSHQQCYQKWDYHLSIQLSDTVMCILNPREQAGKRLKFSKVKAMENDCTVSTSYKMFFNTYHSHQVLSEDSCKEMSSDWVTNYLQKSIRVTGHWLKHLASCDFYSMMTPVNLTCLEVKLILEIRGGQHCCVVG